mgnify:FL=1
MTKNILHNIEKNMSSFSKGQKLIARFILELSLIHISEPTRRS